MIRSRSMKLLLAYKNWAEIKTALARGETPDAHDVYEQACYEMKRLRRELRMEGITV